MAELDFLCMDDGYTIIVNTYPYYIYYGIEYIILVNNRKFVFVHLGNNLLVRCVNIHPSKIFLLDAKNKITINKNGKIL